MTTQTLASALASELFRLSHSATHADDAKANLETLVKNFLPSGSGFDDGTKIDLDKSTPTKLVLDTAFHHMNEHGYYDGWTNHQVVVTPTFYVHVLNILVKGSNRNDIKAYIAEAFGVALNTMIETTFKDGEFEFKVVANS